MVDSVYARGMILVLTATTAACALVVGAVRAEADNEYRWTNVVMKAPFPARDGAGALVHQDRMWLIGGWDSRNDADFPLDTVNDVWSSSDGAAWRLERKNTFGLPTFDPSREWEGRHTAGYAIHQGKMWIIGGDPIQGHYQNDVWNSEDGRTWHWVNRDHPVPWGPRALHYTAAFQGKLWVMGGQTLPQFASAPERFCDDVWNSEDGVHWTLVPQEGERWAPRGMIGGAAVFKGRLWILGGGSYDTPGAPQRRFYNDVWSSADGAHWTRHLDCAPWAPRQYHDVAVFDEKLWVLEGWNQENRNDVWHSEDGVEWREVPDTPWAPRHAASVFVYQDALWMVAGNNMQSDVWKLERVKGDEPCEP